DERIRTAYWRLCIRFGLRRGPRLLVSDEVTSPVLIGILNPIILIPRTLLEICTESDVESMLAHEIAHHCRRDLIWCWLPTLMQCLLFFHPVVWLARREWLSVQELACDELALSVTRQSPLEYGDTLLRVVALCRSAHNPFVTTASAVGTLQGFKRRIEFIRQ